MQQGGKKVKKMGDCTFPEKKKKGVGGKKNY